MTDQTETPSNLYQGIQFIAEAFHEMRARVLASLSDGDLAFTITGNPTLGALLADFVGIEQSYAQSFTSLKQDWAAYRAPTPSSSISEYTAAFDRSFQALKNALSGYTLEQGSTVTVERGGWAPTLTQQFDTYAQAALIMFGKLDVYLKAMSKPLPERWTEWVG
jgi:hypothetical protein